MNSDTETVIPAATHSSRPDSTPPTTCADMPDMPPQKEHAWLQQLTGDWETEIEMCGAPDQPAMKTKGTDQVRMIGGFWLVSEGRNDAFPYVCRLTLGYDPLKQKYVGTWIDSMSSYLWHYEGVVDAIGRRLTLETEGPFPPMPNAPMTKFREVTEIKSKDHRVFTSARLAEDGQWVTCVRINFRRKRA